MDGLQAILGAEDDVVIERGIGVSHSRTLQPLIQTSLMRRGGHMARRALALKDQAKINRRYAATPCNTSSRITINQIEQRKKKDPDNIHKMPVEAGQLNRRMIFRRKTTASGLDHQYCQDADAYDHVQGMHAGHGEVERKEELGILRPWP